MTSRKGAHQPGEGRHRHPGRSTFDDKSLVRATGEIALVSHARLSQCPATCQPARAAPTAGEAIQASCLTALTRQKPLAARLSPFCIYIGQPPRSRCRCPTATSTRQIGSLGLYEVFEDDLGSHPRLLGHAVTSMCGSRCVARVEANALARRALPSSPLHCRGHSVGSSGADVCVALFPLSPLPVCRFISLWHWQLAGGPAAAQEVAEREDRVASARPRVSARVLVARGCRVVRGPCMRCGCREATIPVGIVAYAPRRFWDRAARRARWSWWLVRSRAARFDRMYGAGRRVPTGAIAGPGCCVGVA